MFYISAPTKKISVGSQFGAGTPTPKGVLLRFIDIDGSGVGPVVSPLVDLEPVEPIDRFLAANPRRASTSLGIEIAHVMSSGVTIGVAAVRRTRRSPRLARLGLQPQPHF